MLSPGAVKCEDMQVVKYGTSMHAVRVDAAPLLSVSLQRINR